MKSRTIAALSAATAVVLPLSAAAESVSLKFLTAWDQRYRPYQAVVHEFGKSLKDASKGEIGLNVVGPEVVKPKQQFQPTTRGVFDLNWSTVAYFVGSTTVVFPFYGMPPKPTKWRESGVWGLADKDFGRHNQKLLALLGGGHECNQFHFMLKRPVSQEQGMKGMKIRANIFYRDLVVPLGGSMVNLDAGEIYSALQKGVVDGAAWPVTGAVDFKWYEVAKYMMRPRFGCTVTTLAMNLDRYRKLSAAHRGTLDEETRKLELAVLDRLTKMDSEEIAELKRLGVKETWLDKKKFAELARARRNGMWVLAAKFNKKSAPYIEELHALARKHGLAE